MLLLVYVHFLIAQTGETALMFAASHGKYDVVVELISLEANVDIQDYVTFIIIIR